MCTGRGGTGGGVSPVGSEREKWGGRGREREERGWRERKERRERGREGEGGRERERMGEGVMPMLLLNMGGEMLYILEQRLQAQAVGAEKSARGEHASSDLTPCLPLLLSHSSLSSLLLSLPLPLVFLSFLRGDNCSPPLPITPSSARLPSGHPSRVPDAFHLAKGRGGGVRASVRAPFRLSPAQLLPPSPLTPLIRLHGMWRARALSFFRGLPRSLPLPSSPPSLPASFLQPDSLALNQQRGYG